MKRFCLQRLVVFAVCAFALPDCSAQITITKERMLTNVSGLRTVGQRMFVDANSKPEVIGVGVIGVDTKEFKHSMIECERILPSGVREPVNLEVVSVDNRGTEDDPKDDEISAYLVTGAGRYKISGYHYSDKTGFKKTVGDLEIDGSPTPVPVDPVVPPIPPQDLPFPSVAGLTVMVVIEQDDLPKINQARAAIVYAEKTRTYLNESCVKVDGLPQWRILDEDTVFDTDSIWKAAMLRKRNSVPWIVISNGKTGYEGPLPDTIDATIALVSKYK